MNNKTNITKVDEKLNGPFKPSSKLTAFIAHQTATPATNTIAIVIQSHLRLFLFCFSIFSPINYIIMRSVFQTERKFNKFSLL